MFFIDFHQIMVRQPHLFLVIWEMCLFAFNPIGQVRASALKPKLEEKLSFSLWAEAKREETRFEESRRYSYFNTLVLKYGKY